jgi:hypothetical protein
VSLYPALDPNYFGVSGSDSGASSPDSGAIAGINTLAFAGGPQNSFVGLAEGFVATTTLTGTVAASVLAASEAGGTTGTIAMAISQGGEIAVIGGAQAFSEIGAAGLFVGAPLGAVAGILALPALGAGYAFGSYISPWVNSHLIDPILGY